MRGAAERRRAEKRAGGPGSSEDDPPGPFLRSRTDARRGLNPAPDEHRPAVAEYDDALRAAPVHLQVLFGRERDEPPEAAVGGRLGELRVPGELGGRRVGEPKPESC